MVIDSYGRILEEQSIETVARASDWNVGIFSFKANDDLTISIQRTGWTVLNDVNCQVLVENLDSDWSTVKLVDIAGSDFAPVVTLPAPTGMSQDDELRATVSCDAPYDIDDDPEDDQKIAFYSAPAEPIVETSEVLVSIVVATILLIVAFLAGATRTEPKPTGTLRKGTEEVKSVVEPKEEDPEPIEEIDKFSFEPAEQIDEIPMQDETTQAIVESIEVIDLPDEEDATPSGRLASMRDEITSDRPSSEGRQDRMRKFFGNE